MKALRFAGCCPIFSFFTSRHLIPKLSELHSPATSMSDVGT